MWLFLPVVLSLNRLGICVRELVLDDVLRCNAEYSLPFQALEQAHQNDTVLRSHQDDTLWDALSWDHLFVFLILRFGLFWNNFNLGFYFHQRLLLPI